MKIFIKPIVVVTVLSIFRLSLGCCGAQPLSEEQLAKKLVQAHIKNLKRGETQERQETLAAIQEGMAHIESPIPGRHFSPVEEAIDLGEPELVRLLLNAKACADGNMHYAPLHFVAEISHIGEEKQLQIAKDLLGARAAIDKVYNLKTALSIAATRRNLPLTRLLLNARASVDTRLDGSYPYSTPLKRMQKQVADNEHVIEQQIEAAYQKSLKDAELSKKNSLQELANSSEKQIYKLMQDAQQASAAPRVAAAEEKHNKNGE